MLRNMCVVSNLGDQWGRDFPDRWPQVPIVPATGTGTGTSGTLNIYPSTSEISKEDFDALRAEVIELKILLLAAKRFDAATGQPDCEMDEKVELIRRVAEMVGVNVDEVFGEPQ